MYKVFCGKCKYFAYQHVGDDIAYFCKKVSSKDGLSLFVYNKNNDCKYFKQKQKQKWWKKLLHIK